MTSTQSLSKSRPRGFLERLLPKRRPSNMLYQEILYLSSRTQSFDELLTAFPRRICEALDLSFFHIFLREGSVYILQQPSNPEAQHVGLPASSSTVSRMRRDRKPAAFVAEATPNTQPDGWQLLAAPLELAILTSLHAQLLVPLDGRTGLMGFMTLARATDRPFTSAELHFLRELGPQMGRGLETSQLVRTLSQQAIERARAHRELEVAREVQERLLPAELPSIPSVDAAFDYRSLEQIGGDYYDFFRTPTGALCTVVADVSGKGIAAALLMASLRASLHALLLESTLPLTSLVERLNSLLYKASSSSRYATLFVCLYDPATRQLTCVNAGHNPPLLLRAGGLMERLTVGGTVVGLLPSISCESETLALGPGDTLVLYTDGVSEATNPEGAEWGESGLCAAILSVPLQPETGSAQMLERILSTLHKFTADSTQADDSTLVILRIFVSSYLEVER